MAACQQLLVAAGRLSPDSNAVAPADTVVGPAVDHLGRLKVTAIRASSCLCCPGPGDENVGPLALASIGLPTAAAEHADQPGVATIPTMGAGDEGSLTPAPTSSPVVSVNATKTLVQAFIRVAWTIATHCCSASATDYFDACSRCRTLPPAWSQAPVGVTT